MSQATRRRRIFQVIESNRRGGPLARIIDLLLIGLILANVLAAIVETLPDFPEGWRGGFALFEAFSVTVFTVEYLLRLWVSVERDSGPPAHPLTGRLRWMFSPLALIDLLVILPFYLSFFVALDLRFLRVLRLLRVVKLTRYSASMRLLLDVAKTEAPAIGAAFFVMSLLLVIAASMMYLVEQRAQPEHFGSVPQSLWWAVVTMTTVGYGDVVPVTMAGKVIAAAVAVISVGMVALPAGILASGFNDLIHRRRREFEHLVEAAAADGVIDRQERRLLDVAAEEMGIEPDEANMLKLRVLAAHQAGGPRFCPHCGEALHLGVREE